MTVKDLVEELSSLPQDLPVVSCWAEIEKVHVCEITQFLDNYSESGYTTAPAVILE